MLENIAKVLEKQFKNKVECSFNSVGELTVEVPSHELLEICSFLKTDSDCLFEQLMDLCGVDYLHYGKDEWHTLGSTATGFSRGVLQQPSDKLERNNLSRNKSEEKENSELEDLLQPNKRFAVIYHLLSISHNQRIRVKSHPLDYPPLIPSVINIWNCADWFEREAFDLYGVLFTNHPDLRRILTDYGFIGHPFRKDFPLIGEVEVKYDEKQERVIYQPVTIEPRTLTPKVIRKKDFYARD